MATATLLEIPVEAEPIAFENDYHEVVDGQFVARPNMGTYPTEIASILAGYLIPHARQAGLGRVIVEPIFRIDAKTQSRPDVAFISFEKWPKSRRTPDHEPWNLIPDLAVEVISKNDQAVAVLAKLDRYFRAGVGSVWLVYPTLEVIHVYDSFTQIRVLIKTDVLDGGQIIPGFQLPLASLFDGGEPEGDLPISPAD